MNVNQRILERRFAAIGARVKTSGLDRGELRINVLSDRIGEYFGDFSLNATE